MGVGNTNLGFQFSIRRYHDQIGDFFSKEDIELLI